MLWLNTLKEQSFSRWLFMYLADQQRVYFSVTFQFGMLYV